MSGATLVRTTMVGVRPLGVRGEPLHQAQAQIRNVIRRRLGERHYHLLAEPEPHDLGGRIDWYSELAGPVQPLAALPDAERARARADIDALLADIDRLGQSLEAGPTEDGRLAGKSLRLAAIRPSDDYLFVVGNQPVVVCWGYDTEAAGAVLPGAFLSSATRVSPLPVAESAAPPMASPVAPGLVPAMAPAGVAALPRARTAWWLWLLAGLLAIAILMLAAWLLRHYLPVPPDLRVTELPTTPSPPPDPPRPDPALGLRRDLEAARDGEGKLRATLASLRDEFTKRHAACAPAKKPDLPEERWKQGDLALMEGCWILGKDADGTWRRDGKSVPVKQRAGRICFDTKGKGTREATTEFGDGFRVVCKAPVTGAFDQDGSFRTEQPEVHCNPASHRWYGKPNWLTCRRMSDTIAECKDTLGNDYEFRRAAGG